MNLEVVRYDGVAEHTIGFFQDKCSGTNVDQAIPGFREAITIGAGDALGAGTLLFDDKNGRLVIPIQSHCKGSPCPYGDNGVFWLAAIEGFATTFDVLQTYTPHPAQVGFRVPYMPEGMAAADSFDTYWGDLSTVGNWGQAHGLQCHYPASPPARGDYLTVADPLPSPQPGHGYYYVTAATYQGQTRYGRKTNGGRLSGRDPAQLPRCSGD
ncbi:MAG: hypothetical protein LAO51_20100 [Acidobacteriia bacterium]|nr:hypothetical protein [Terriglobia bacterium]